MRPKIRILALALAAATAWGQPPAPAEEPVTFRTSVQLVTIPVVVRDREGRAVGTLEQNDFQLSDTGKRQEIAKFSMERADGAGPRAPGSDVSRPGARLPAAPPLDVVPNRFVAYLFDDIHLKAGDLIRVRKAAEQHLRAAIGPGDRAAIYSTSGVLTIDFTSDLDALRAGLARLMPRPMLQQTGLDCPSIDYYQADLMLNKNNQLAFETALKEVQLRCNPGDPEAAKQLARFAARTTLMQGEQETRTSLSSIHDAARRMEVLAGERELVLVSPGFLMADLQRELLALIQAAIHARVKVSALDARGLYVDPVFDASVGSYSSDPQISIAKSSFVSAAASASANVMAEVSAGTGGRFFQNSNDLESGFQRLAAAPEFVYLLSFSPKELKFDGKYHTVKVTLRNGKGLTVEARQGYYAPMRFSDPKAQATHEIRRAVLSREEVSEFPVELLAQYFEHTGKMSQVTVHARVYPQNIKLRKSDGRNYNQIRIVSTLFDTNGILVAGKEQIVELQLRDATVERANKTGIVVRTDFEVKPGPYLVRMVVRDAEGQQISAQNSVVGRETTSKKK